MQEAASLKGKLRVESREFPSWLPRTPTSNARWPQPERAFRRLYLGRDACRLARPAQRQVRTGPHTYVQSHPPKAGMHRYACAIGSAVGRLTSSVRPNCPWGALISMFKSLLAAVALTIRRRRRRGRSRGGASSPPSAPPHSAVVIFRSTSSDPPDIFWSPAGGNPIHYARTSGFYAGR